MQCNCRGLRGKILYLANFIAEFDIVCIQETIMDCRSSFGVPGYACLRRDVASQSQRGICILIRREIEFRMIDLSHITHDSIEIQGICVRFNNNYLNIVNLYRHSGSYTPVEVFRNIFESFGRDDNVLILGDFNSHHVAWGCETTDRVGRALISVIDDLNLVVLNDRFPTLVQPPGHNQSVIDLALASPGIAPICSAVTSSDTGYSDHLPIHIQIGGLLQRKSKFKYKIHLNKEELDRLNSFLYNESPATEADPSDNPLIAYEELVRRINSGISAVAPGKARAPSNHIVSGSKSQPPWWNDVCQETVVAR